MAIDGTFLMLACCFSLYTIQNFSISLLIWNYSHTGVLYVLKFFSDILLVLSVIREDIFVCVIFVYYLKRYE